MAVKEARIPANTDDGADDNYRADVIDKDSESQ